MDEAEHAHERNPWTTLSSKVVYENAWMRVREDQVLRPDGEPGIYGMVVKGAATGVVAIDEQDRVVLVGQYRYPTSRYSWEIVEGGAEAGETPLEAIQRELAEETGLAARSWEPLGGEVQISNCVTAELGYLFVARDLYAVGDPSPDATEELRVERVPFAEALARVDSGEISDAFSVIALLRLARLRAQA